MRARSQSAPSRESSRLAASSSVATRRAATSTASRPRPISGRTWSTPHARLTAVGRAWRTRSTAACTCASPQPSRAPSSMASTTPSAPATPRAGAPRTASSAIATTRSSVVSITAVCGGAGQQGLVEEPHRARPSRPAASSHAMAISVMAAAYAAPPPDSVRIAHARRAVPGWRIRNGRELSALRARPPASPLGSRAMTPEPRPRRRTVRRSAAAGLLTLAVVATPVAVTATASAVGAEPTVLTPIGGGYEASTLAGFSRAAAEGASGPTVDIVVVPSAYGDTDKERKANLALAQQRTDQVDAACDAAVTRPVHRVHGHPGGAAQPGRRAGPGQLRGARRAHDRRHLRARRRPGDRDGRARRTPPRRPPSPPPCAAGGGARRHQRRGGRRVAQHDQRLHHSGRQPRARPAAGTRR